MCSTRTSSPICPHKLSSRDTPPHPHPVCRISIFSILSFCVFFFVLPRRSFCIDIDGKEERERIYEYGVEDGTDVTKPRHLLGEKKRSSTPAWASAFQEVSRGYAQHLRRLEQGGGLRLALRQASLHGFFLIVRLVKRPRGAS